MGEFRCYRCNKLMIFNVEGDVKLELYCPRCNSFVTIFSKSPFPLSKRINELQEKIASQISQDMIDSMVEERVQLAMSTLSKQSNETVTADV